MYMISNDIHIVQCGYGIKETSRGRFKNKHVIASPARECTTTF